MHHPAHRGSTLRKVLSLAGFAAVITVIGVQTANGASSTAGAPVTSATAGALPADQPALDTAADDAQSVAGSAYYTGAAVNDDSNTVDVYLAGAPQSVIDQLQAMHPGIYVIHNDATYPLTELMQLETTLPISTLSAEGVDVKRIYVTPDGHLKVGVRGSTAANVQAAQTAVASVARSTFGAANSAGPTLAAGIVQVYGGAQPTIAQGYRYNEGTPYNGGDFISFQGNDWTNGGKPAGGLCSSGIEVHKTGNTSLTYILTAAHCDWNLGSSSNPGVGTSALMGYQENNGNWMGPDIQHLYMGSTKYISNDSDRGSDVTTLDAQLIPASTGHDVFKSGWNSTEIGVITGGATNHVGDHVCTSGAVTGEICGLVIQSVEQKDEITHAWPDYWVFDSTALNPNASGYVAAAEGDSGGPVYWVNSSTGDRVARGMIEGGGTYVSCFSLPSWPTGLDETGCTHDVEFIGMEDINGGFNVTPNN